MSHSLFIGSLSWNTTEHALSAHLSSVAPVLSVKIPLDRLSGKSRGFAFVDVASQEDAERIIAELNERELDGRTLHISIAKERIEETEPCKLYIAGLADSVTENALQHHLSSAGVVTSVSIVTDRNTGRSRGFAFVETASEQDSDAIIQTLNGSLLENKSILVRKSRLMNDTPRKSFNRHR